jgi:hypothetical protein
MFKVWRLKWQRWRLQHSYAKDYKNLVKKKASQDELMQLHAGEHFDVEAVEQQIDFYIGTKLSDKARSLDVEIPHFSDKQMWVHGEQGYFWFSSKGRAHVRKLIDEERARRFEVKSQWFIKIILPTLGLVIGIVGAITGLVAVLHQKK